MRPGRAGVAFLLCAGNACFAQGPVSSQNAALTALRVDARAVAEREIAIVKLQALQKRPTGPQSTPEQDRLSEHITEDYEFVQNHTALWKKTPYADAFANAVRADLHDPELRKEDPFKVSGRPEAVTTGAGGGGDRGGGATGASGWNAWFIIGSLIAILCVVSFAMWVIRKLATRAIRGGHSSGMPSGGFGGDVSTNRAPRGGGFLGGDDFPTGGAPIPASSTGDGLWGRPCPACHGAKTVPCQLCAMSGLRWNGSEQSTCTSCYGHRIRPCDTCNGVGRVNW